MDVPIESVDAETHGKKSGETHYNSSLVGEEVFYSYNLFQSKRDILESLKRLENKSPRIVRKSEIVNSRNVQIGTKLLISTQEGYELYWTKDLMMRSAKSESLRAIEEIEKGCNL